MPQMIVSNIAVDLIRKDIKNIHLAVYPPAGRVRLATPNWVKDETIRLFLISKLSWIKRQQRKFAEQQRQTARQYSPRESHYLFGKRYLLNVIDDAPFAKVMAKHKKIELYTRKDTGTVQKQRIINKWYRKELRKIIPELIEKWEQRMNVKVHDFRVKQMKTKWGTCNREAKRIWLNLELAKKPVQCLEYIIVHEMVHLLERYHNDKFLYYMNQFLPNWKALKHELNRLPFRHEDWKY
jgi:predicted metal-dependent hydrolase